MEPDQQYPYGGGRHRRPAPDPYASPDPLGQPADGRGDPLTDPLHDPLTDPLPGRHTDVGGYAPEHHGGTDAGYGAQEPDGSGWDPPGGTETSSWFQPRAGRRRRSTAPLHDPLTDPLPPGPSDPLREPLGDPLTDPLPGSGASPTASPRPDERYHDPLFDPLPGSRPEPTPDPLGHPTHRPYRDPLHDPLTDPAAPHHAVDPLAGSDLPPPRAGGEPSLTGHGGAPDPLTDPLTDPLGEPPRAPLGDPLTDRPHDPLGVSGHRSDTAGGRHGALDTDLDSDVGSGLDTDVDSDLGGRDDGPEPDPFDHTMALRPVGERISSGRTLSAQPPGEDHDADREGDGADAATSTGGRAARRRALKAQKPGPGVIASRVIGELFITCGLVMLLFVAYQVWWTNVLAERHTQAATKNLREEWQNAGPGKDRASGPFKPGEEFAIMYIPKLDVIVPIAEGIDKHKVLDNGMLGHYSEGELKSAMPWDKTGNFAVAGHRNTHGEPFRYINRLVAGDPIVVETKHAYYTYEMTNRLPSTPPSNTDVISPVPRQSGFTKPGRYITLTTCTPEFTSKYRLIVWGKLVEERPRTEGKPDALTS